MSYREGELTPNKRDMQHFAGKHQASPGLTTDRQRLRAAESAREWGSSGALGAEEERGEHGSGASGQLVRRGV